MAASRLSGAWLLACALARGGLCDPEAHLPDPTFADMLGSTLMQLDMRSESEKMSEVKRQTVQAWFDVAESQVPKWFDVASVDYSKIPTCSEEDVAYINVVVHVQKGSWSTVCGNLSSIKNARGPPLKEMLDKLAPQLPTVDVYLPFGLHDGVNAGGRPGRKEQHVPVFSAAYHKFWSPAVLPFAMANYRAPEDSDLGYINTPVIGWDKFVKTWFSCNTTTPSIRKAVFRGKAGPKGVKYGTCTNACSWRDNGRLLVHSVGLEEPMILDAAVSNSDVYNIPELAKYSNTVTAPPIPFPEQLCNYQAILNIGNNMDWAERLRSSFYGNAILMLPEDSAVEFFSSFMQPYVHYWPLKNDLSDIKEQIRHVLALPNVTLQLQAQHAFADKFLTESFMLSWNYDMILEYDRRVRMFKAGSWTAPSDIKRQKAQELLRLNGCSGESSESDPRTLRESASDPAVVKRECPPGTLGPAEPV